MRSPVRQTDQRWRPAEPMTIQNIRTLSSWAAVAPVRRRAVRPGGCPRLRPQEAPATEGGEVPARIATLSAGSGRPGHHDRQVPHCLSRRRPRLRSSSGTQRWSALPAPTRTRQPRQPSPARESRVPPTSEQRTVGDHDQSQARAGRRRRSVARARLLPRPTVLTRRATVPIGEERDFQRSTIPKSARRAPTSGPTDTSTTALDSF